MQFPKKFGTMFGIAIAILAMVLPVTHAETGNDPVAKKAIKNTDTIMIPSTSSTDPATSDFVANIFRNPTVQTFIMNNLSGTNVTPLLATIGETTIGFSSAGLYVAKGDMKIRMAGEENGRYCWGNQHTQVTCTDMNTLLSGVSQKDLVEVLNANMAGVRTTAIKQ